MPHPLFYPDLASCDLFLFPQTYKVLSVPEKPLTQPSVSAQVVYLNQRTVTHFMKVFAVCYIFQTAANILKECNVHSTIFELDAFKIPYNTYIRLGVIREEP